MNIRHLLIILSIALFASACGSATTPDPNVRGAPTTTPPPWIEAAGIIGLDTAAQVSYLGRLDAAGIPSTIFAHSLSPDGTRLAAIDNESIMAWDLISGNLVFTVGRGDTNQIFYAPDKTEIYALTAGGKVTIHDANRGAVQNTFDSIDDFTGTVTFEPEAGWLAVGNLRGQIKIWDPLERQALTVIDGHRLQVVALAFSTDGERLASSSEDGTVKVWNWRSKELIASFETEDIPYTLRYSPTGDQVAGASTEKVLLFSLADNQTTRTIDVGTGGTDLLLYSPDGNYVLSGGLVQEMTLWNPQTGALVARLPESNGDRISAVFAPDSDLLLTSEMGSLPALWNMTTITNNTLNRATINNPAQIFTVDWTSDSRVLTLFGSAGSVYLWGIGTQPTPAAS